MFLMVAGLLIAFWIWAYLVDFGGRLAHLALPVAAALVVIGVLDR